MSGSQTETLQVLGRAGKRAAFHLLQALIESLRAVEAVIEEIGRLGDENGDAGDERRERIEIE